MKNLVLSAIKHSLQIVYLRRIKHEAIILYTENVIRYIHTLMHIELISGTLTMVNVLFYVKRIHI